MEVQDAVKLAKQYVIELFRDEEPTNIGLEEIEFDDQSEAWNVTIGFSRPWSGSRNALAAITGDAIQRGRAFKIVRIRDTDGKMLGLKRRDLLEG